MGGIIDDSTDSELQLMKKETEVEISRAEKGAGNKGASAQDTDAGIALGIALSAVTGGISNMIEVAVTTFQEVKGGANPLPAARSGKGRDMFGGHRHESRFTDVAAPEAKKTSVNLMTVSAVGVDRKAKADPAIDAGGIKIAKQSLRGISGAKVDPKSLTVPKMDTSKLKFKLGRIERELKEDANLAPESSNIDRRMEEKLKRGDDRAEIKVEQAPIIKEKLAQKSASPAL